MYIVIAILLLGSSDFAFSKMKSRTNISECYDSTCEFYPLMSTRTAYELIHGQIKRPSPSCQPKQIWGVIRHGTRFLKSHEIGPVYVLTELRNQIIKNHKKGLGKLCPQELATIESWNFSNDISPENSDLLTEQGNLELYHLAQRLQKTFPELLTVNHDVVNRQDFILTATNTTRAIASLESFMNGLSGNESLLRPDIPLTNDTLLFKQKNCTAWNIDYIKNDYDKQRRLFTQGPEYKQVIMNVRKRLGFSMELTDSLVKAMYQMCRFELAWNPRKKSVWCSVFSKEDLKIFEYCEDLNNYYCCGAGRLMSSQLGCEIMSDMYRHFDDLVNSDFDLKLPKSILYFSHSVPLRTLMTALKMHVETKPITWKTYDLAKNRTFRSSIQGAFAANVLGVFYRCNESKTQNKVMFYVSEKIVEMPGCNEEGIKGFCNWDYLKKMYIPDVETCNFDFCDSSVHFVGSSSHSINLPMENIFLLSAVFILFQPIHT